MHTIFAAARHSSKLGVNKRQIDVKETVKKQKTGEPALKLIFALKFITQAIHKWLAATCLDYSTHPLLRSDVSR